MKISNKNEQNLIDMSKWVRLQVLNQIASVGKGHIGGTYSCTDLLVSLYYGNILKFNASDPTWELRDRLLIGKGHACLALFAIFKDLGFISESTFLQYGKDGGALGGQLDINTPGVECNTGSLGHVLGLGAGIALAAKMDQLKYNTFVLLGDAECYEGSVWEAITFAGEHCLDGLIGIIDRNRLSVTEELQDGALFNNFEEKMKGFGWNYIEIDGHSFVEINEGLNTAMNCKGPTMVMANTVKGKGVSFMENGVEWHHSVPTEKEISIARKELS